MQRIQETWNTINRFWFLSNWINQMTNKFSSQVAFYKVRVAINCQHTVIKLQSRTTDGQFATIFGDLIANLEGFLKEGGREFGFRKVFPFIPNNSNVIVTNFDYFAFQSGDKANRTSCHRIAIIWDYSQLKAISSTFHVERDIVPFRRCALGLLISKIMQCFFTNCDHSTTDFWLSCGNWGMM